jgi:hypothetical protein
LIRTVFGCRLDTQQPAARKLQFCTLQNEAYKIVTIFSASIRIPASHNGVDVGNFIEFRAVSMQQVKGCIDLQNTPPWHGF